MTRFTAIAALTILAAANINQANAQWSNPIVDGYDRRNVQYDPFSDTTYIDNTQHRFRASYYDYDRNQADPGSRRYVDRYVTDQQGRRVHEYGWTWTTNGKPHGDLVREVVTYTPHCNRGGGVVNRDRDIISYSPQQGGGTVQRDRDIVSFGAQSQGGTYNRNRQHVGFGSQPGGGTVNRNKQIISFGAVK